MLYKTIVEKTYKKYCSLKQLLTTESIIENKQKYARISKEIAKLNKFAQSYEVYLALEKEIEELKKELKQNNNTEYVEIFKLEIKAKSKELEDLSKKIPNYLIVEREEEQNHCYIEIQGRAGGNEANIFTGDLLDMYLRYLTKKGWKTEIISKSVSEFGGYTEVLFAVKEKGAYGFLMMEAGIHRVQRVPITESKGRIHTSTARVVVSPIIKKTDIKIKRDDLEIQTFRSSGAGGQHVNKTDSAVRIIHKPTGIVATSQAGRSQHDNKENALKVIASRLKNIELQKEREAKKKFYKAAGAGSRSEKIRTYNYAQNRITDHRLKKSWLKLDRIMMGDLEEIMNELNIWQKQMQLEDLLASEKE